MGLMRLPDGTEVLDFGRQGRYSTYQNNTRDRSFQVWNKYLRVSGRYVDFSDFLNNRDTQNRYWIDKESLLKHHHDLWQIYHNSQDLYYQPPTASRARPEQPYLPLTHDMWRTRLTELVGVFGANDVIRLPVGRSRAGDFGFKDNGVHTFMIGTNTLTPDEEEVWRFLQQFLIPNRSSIYLVKTSANDFSLHFNIDPIESINFQTLMEQNLPRNWLWYGAPGNGKSHSLKLRAENLVANQEDYFPFSFSPATTYGDFVGEYRPKMIYSDDGEVFVDIRNNNLTLPPPGTPAVDYAYVPGVFMKALLRAYTIQTPVVLLIDEINRGDIYEILGEVFQLMERDYSMGLHSEAMNYLNASLFKHYEIDSLEEEGLRELCERSELETEGIDAGDLDSLKILLKSHIRKEKIQLPNNFYMWGTMNPNDASVQQIDSAFFRRWTSKYIGIDYIDEMTGEENDSQLLPGPLDILLPGPLDIYYWGPFRKEINEKILSMGGYDEEDLIGRWFLSTAEFRDWEKFYSKLVFHLANNVLKMNLKDDESIFIGDSVRKIMKMCKEGNNPFKDGILTSEAEAEATRARAAVGLPPTATEEELAAAIARAAVGLPPTATEEELASAIARAAVGLPPTATEEELAAAIARVDEADEDIEEE